MVLIVAGVLAGGFAAAAFDGDGKRPLGVKIEWLTPEPTKLPASDPEPTARATPTARPTAVATPVLVTGLAYPIADGCLPEDDGLMPGALREYRNAIHEGVDFYDADNCAFIGLDTEVLAAADGIVVRADHDYEELTVERLAEIDELVEIVGGDDEQVTDAYRGRQVWIDHGDGVVTRYAHLSGIAEEIDVGTRVRQGDLVAYVGDSGTPESVTAPGTEMHLHFEVRVGSRYLGQGMSPARVRELYEQAFSP